MCVCSLVGSDGGHPHPGSGYGQSELSRGGHKPVEHTRRCLEAPNTAQAPQRSLGWRLPAAQRAQEEVCVCACVLLWLRVMYNLCLSYFQMSLKVNFYETSLFLICPRMKICLQALDNWRLTVTTDILCNGGQWKGKWRLVEMPDLLACHLFNYNISWLVTLHCVTSVGWNCTVVFL